MGVPGPVRGYRGWDGCAHSGMRFMVQDRGAWSGTMQCPVPGEGAQPGLGVHAPELRLCSCSRRAAGTAGGRRARRAAAATPRATAAPSASTRIGRSTTTSAGRLCRGCRAPPPPGRASPTGCPPWPAAPARRARWPRPAPAPRPRRRRWTARPAEPPSDCESHGLHPVQFPQLPDSCDLRNDLSSSHN